jgi:hypothetical protein
LANNKCNSFQDIFYTTSSFHMGSGQVSANDYLLLEAPLRCQVTASDEKHEKHKQCRGFADSIGFLGVRQLRDKASKPGTGMDSRNWGKP